MTLDEILFGLPAQQDDTRREAPTSDTLSDAHMIQLMLDMLYYGKKQKPKTPGSLHVHVNPVESIEHYVSSGSDAPAGLAQNMATMEIGVSSVPEKADDVLSFFREVDMSGEREMELEPSDVDVLDAAFNPTGVTPAADVDFLSAPPNMGMQATPPSMGVAPSLDMQQGGLSASAISPLAEALRPDISDISRLGGGFAGYTEPDRLLERIRQLVRRL